LHLVRSLLPNKPRLSYALTGSTERDAPVPMGLRLSASHPAPKSLALKGSIERDVLGPMGELRSSGGHTSLDRLAHASQT
jgi:hypothetical protein